MKGEEAGLLEQVKSQICDNISLFAQNYSENFGDYLPKFVTAVWNLLVTTSLETKYDLVIICDRKQWGGRLKEKINRV